MEIRHKQLPGKLTFIGRVPALRFTCNSDVLFLSFLTLYKCICIYSALLRLPPPIKQLKHDIDDQTSQ